MRKEEVGIAMKPRSKPGKIGSAGRAARSAISRAKPLSPSQMERLRIEDNSGKGKAGRGGKRADWDIDYEQGMQYAMKKMPDRDNQSLTIDGIRKTPKNGR